MLSRCVPTEALITLSKQDVLLPGRWEMITTNTVTGKKYFLQSYSTLVIQLTNIITLHLMGKR